MTRRIALLALLLTAACGPAAAPRGGATRVVSQVVFADEELWHFGPQVRARVVAVSIMADDARYSDAVDLWPESVPRIGGAEAIAAQAPDLVITAEFTAAETRAVLEQLGIVTVQLDGWNGFADYRRHVRTLAQAVGAESAGEARIAGFDDELEALRTRNAGGPRPSVVSWQEGTVAGSGTAFADAAEAAGFVDLAAQRGVVGHQNIGLETLVSWDPEYIVVPCERDCAALEREMAARAGFASTRAGRHGGIIAIEAHHLYSVGFGMLEVVRQLGARRREAPP